MSSLTLQSGAADLLHEARSRERAACIPEAVHYYEAAISAAERAGEKPILAEALRRLAVVLATNRPGRATCVAAATKSRAGSRTTSSPPKR